EAVPISTLGESPPLPTRVAGEGRFDASRQLLLDNQVRDQQLGVLVYTPWRDAEGRWILVARGWAPWPERSARLPDPGLPGPEAPIHGFATAAPGVGVRLGEPEPPSPVQWPQLVTYLDPQAFANVLGGPVAPWIVKLDPGHPAHLTGRPWQPVTFGPERHVGYAIQWTLIGLVVTGLWIGLTLRTRRTGTSKQEPDS
ncbi:MAG: SURF1 family protein, partial [Wenzhouxiangellaceae bacterium]|nr:SURF1 family protein [Wenzhouxiangellaceae bacterium]